MGKLKLSTGNLVIAVAGVLIFLASFLSFFKLPTTHVGTVTIGGSFTAWARGNFAMATLPALLGLAMAAEVLLRAFAPRVRLGDGLLSLNWDQLHLVLAAQALVLMVAWVLVDTGQFDRGAGFWLMLVCSVGLVVGAVLRARETARAH